MCATGTELALLRQYPEFGAYSNDAPIPEELVTEWMRRRIAKFGEYLHVGRLPADHVVRTNVIAEGDADGIGTFQCMVSTRPMQRSLITRHEIGTVGAGMMTSGPRGDRSLGHGHADLGGPPPLSATSRVLGRSLRPCTRADCSRRAARGKTPPRPGRPRCPLQARLPVWKIAPGPIWMRRGGRVELSVYPIWTKRRTSVGDNIRAWARAALSSNCGAIAKRMTWSELRNGRTKGRGTLTFEPRESAQRLRVSR